MINREDCALCREGECLIGDKLCSPGMCVGSRAAQERFEVLKAMNLLAKTVNDDYDHWILGEADDEELREIAYDDEGRSSVLHQICKGRRPLSWRSALSRLIRRIIMNKINDAINAISQLSQASDYLLGNLLSVTEESLDVLGVTVSKEYHEGARPPYKMRWQLDDTSWRTLAEALTTLDPGREDLIHIVAEPADEYARLSFDYEGHEFMCLMLREQAERLGYIEPEPEQMVIEGV